MKLRPQVFEVLVSLISHRQRVVSKDELLEQLRPGQFIGDGSLNACLMAVRRASSPPSESQDTPIERGWGILETPWSGA